MSENSVREVVNGAPVTDPAPSNPTDPTNAVEVLYLPGWNPDPTLSIETTASADELWQAWENLCEQVTTIDHEVDLAAQRYRDSLDSGTKDRVWSDYEALTRQYRVHSAWRDVFHAAYVFATDGAACAATGFVPPAAPSSGPREF